MEEADESAGQSLAASSNMRSLELWQKWRVVDLGGGLERSAASKAAATQLREGMRALELNSMLGAAAPTMASGQGQPQDVVWSFGEAVARELELLEAATAT